MFNKTNPQCPTTNSGISTKTNEFRTTVERTPVVRTAYNGKTTVIQNPDFNRAVCYTNKSTEHKAAANSVINRTGRLKKLSAPLYMFALAFIIAIAGMFSTVEAEASPWWWNYTVSSNFNTNTCCITITVGHALGEYNGNQVRIRQIYDDGTYDVVATANSVSNNPAGHLVATLCAKPGDTKITWKVETYLIQGQSSPPGWKPTVTYLDKPSSGSEDVAECGTDDSCRNHYSTSARLIEKDGKCCIEITVKNSVGCRGLLNFHASYFKDGMPVILAHEQVYTDITADGEYVYIICDLPEDASVTWNVDYEEANPNGGPPFIKRIGGGAFTAKELERCQIAPVDCFPVNEKCREEDWRQRSVRITLPGFPRCPLIYTYYSRVCDGEYQIKGGVIRLDPWWFRNCRQLLDYISGGVWNPSNPQFLTERLIEIFNEAFRVRADMYFDDMVRRTPPGWLRVFDCDNPYDPLRRNVIVTYHRGSCVSHCVSKYLDIFDNIQMDFNQDDCTDGRSCCKISREYCLKLDLETQKYVKQVTETTEIFDNDGFFVCDPIYPEETSCITDGELVESLIFLFRAPCEPVCKDSVNEEGMLKQRFESNSSSNFEIYPNPTNDFLTVSFSEGNFNRLTISDNSGRVYTELAINTKDTEMKIDVSKLTTGVYYIMVTDNNNIIRFKQFIKE